jgi:hypothetical protein
VLLDFTDRVLHKKVAEYQKVDVSSNDEGLRPRRAFIDLLLDMMMAGEMDESEVRQQVNTFMFEVRFKNDVI